MEEEVYIYNFIMDEVKILKKICIDMPELAICKSNFLKKEIHKLSKKELTELVHIISSSKLYYQPQHQLTRKLKEIIYDTKKKEYQTILSLPIVAGHDQLHTLVSEYTNPYIFNSELFIASSKGQFKKVQQLIDQGVDLNIKDEHGRTSLMLACKYNHPKIVQLLIDSGVNVNIRDNDDYSAYFYTNKLDIKELLLDAGEDIHYITKGYSLLHRAISHNNKDEIELLLEHGADILEETSFSEKPITLTSKESIKNLLLQYGAEKDEEDDEESFR